MSGFAENVCSLLLKASGMQDAICLV